MHSINTIGGEFAPLLSRARTILESHLRIISASVEKGEKNMKKIVINSVYA